MSGGIPEADWKVFRSLHPIWIDRFCRRVNDELLRTLSDDSRDAYEQYLAAYKLMHKGTKRSQVRSMISGVKLIHTQKRYPQGSFTVIRPKCPGNLPRCFWGSLMVSLRVADCPKRARLNGLHATPPAPSCDFSHRQQGIACPPFP